MNDKSHLLSKLNRLSSQKKKYLYVPFSEKDKVKGLGAYWDGNKKLWYCQDSKKELFTEWFEQKKKIYLESKYEQKDQVKALGCEWDKEIKAWYCFESNKEALKTFKRRKHLN